MTTQTKPDEKTLARVPGAEPSSRLDAWWGLVVAVVVLIAYLVIFIPDPYRRIIIFTRDGFFTTIRVTVIAFSIVLVLGLFGGLGRLSKNKIIFGISSLYVEVIRGIPLLVQLFWWYFAFPVVIQNLGRSYNIPALINYRPNPIVIAVLGLAFCYGAYVSEIYRAGIQSIPKGQMEAARSQGMSYAQAMRFIILPQTIRVILPPLGNELVTLLKDTALISVVGVIELTRRGREFMAATFNPIPAWSMVALLYLVMTLMGARLVSWIEKRTSFER
jgi:polar amino acid transport system permease protein